MVTLKANVPVKEELDSFILKDVNKENLFNFLREMEFNRLLSQAISFYGEENESSSNKEKDVHKSKISKIKARINVYLFCRSKALLLK